MGKLNYFNFQWSCSSSQTVKLANVVSCVFFHRKTIRKSPGLGKWVKWSATCGMVYIFPVCTGGYVHLKEQQQLSSDSCSSCFDHGKEDHPVSKAPEAEWQLIWWVSPLVESVRSHFRNLWSLGEDYINHHSQPEPCHVHI